MVRHASKRAGGQTLTEPSVGIKRKAPTSKGNGVASADPGRLHGKAKQAAAAGGKGTKGPTPAAGNATPPTQGGERAETKGDLFAEGKKGKGKVAKNSDIDNIFAGVKRLKEAKAEEEAERMAKKKKLKEEHKRRQANPFTGEGGPQKRWAWADEVKPVRFDDEGLPIYTWESLRIGQGGGTAECPFDCDCCF